MHALFFDKAAEPGERGAARHLGIYARGVRHGEGQASGENRKEDERA